MSFQKQNNPQMVDCEAKSGHICSILIFKACNELDLPQQQEDDANIKFRTDKSMKATLIAVSNASNWNKNDERRIQT